MPRLRVASRSLAELAAAQDGLVTRAAALANGWSERSLDHALATRRLHRVLRGVYALSLPVSARQLVAAGLLWAGPSGAVDGITACRVHGLTQLPADERVYVVVERQRHPTSQGFVVVRRSSGPLVTTTRQGLDVLAAPDAVVAATRRMNDVRAVRALVAEAVQRRVVTTDQLHDALDRAPRHRIRLVSTVLREVHAGARSAPEAELAALVATSRILPAPLLNCRLYDACGSRLADPDAYWPDAALVHETDSREWHLSPGDWEATLRRHARMTAAGLLVIHSPPSRIRTDGARLLAQLEAAYRAGLERGPVAGIRHASAA